MKFCLPKLSRRQRVVRNLALAGLLLFGFAWMWDFPAWSPESLVRRVERQYLMEDAQIVYTATNGGGSDPTYYARSGNVFLLVDAEKRPLGLEPAGNLAVDVSGGGLCFASWRGSDSVLALLREDRAAAAKLEITPLDGAVRYAVGTALAPGIFRFGDVPTSVVSDARMETGPTWGSATAVLLYDEGGAPLSRVAITEVYSLSSGYAW